MVSAPLHPSYKTCAESPITSRERIEALLVKAWSNFPFFSYRFWFEYQRHETSVPQNIPFPLLSHRCLFPALKYITQNQDAFLQEKFFFHRNKWLLPRFWLTIWRYLLFLSYKNELPRIYIHCSPSNLLALWCLCEFILEESLFT